MIPLSGLTETQRRQLVLADNRIALNAGWDLEMLNLELKELSVMGADLEALGFTAQELAAALNQGDDGLTDEDDVPAVAEKRRLRSPGDIWCLGRAPRHLRRQHRLPAPSRRCSARYCRA